jgi:hypothetical protein
LGLALSKKIIEHQAGTIAARSSHLPRRIGTTFRITLPVTFGTSRPLLRLIDYVRSLQGTKTGEFQVALMESGHSFKCRVLIVDDEPLVLQASAAIVRSFGFTVRTAEDGFAALKILREVLPDIIISDLRMPNMSGFELLSIVRRRFPHIPTIGISAEFILATMPVGLLVDHFFQKVDTLPTS